MILTPVPATPFTDVVRVLVLEVLATDDTAGDVAVWPVTVEVSVLPESDSEFVIASSTKAVGVTLTHAVPLYCSTLLFANEDMVTGVPVILLTVLAPSVPVTSPVSATVSGVVATPFTVLISWSVPF